MKFKLRGLIKVSEAELIHAFENIPLNTTVLDASGNRLAQKRINILSQVFQFIPPTVSFFQLENNNLGKMRAGKLLQFATAIPVNVSSLDLTKNKLFLQNSQDLAAFFSSFSPNLSKLNLSHNQLKNIQDGNLDIALNAIPATVLELNLCKNNLNLIPLDKLNKLSNTLAHIETVYLSYKEIDRMSPEQRKALGAVFPNVKEVYLLDNNGNKIDPLLEMRLVRALNLSKEVPSLLRIGSFFVAKNKDNSHITGYKEVTPKEVQDFVDLVLSPTAKF